VGPYSVVWFDTRTPDGSEYFSGFVARDGVVLEASCAPGAAVARPWGANSEYPPVLATGTPQGLAVEFDLGKNGTFVANFTTQLVVEKPVEGFYQRLIGPVSGGIKGGQVYDGKALCEEFKFSLASQELVKKKTWPPRK